ncbi:MAG TPA: hypothetical protein VHM26_16855 [Chitinophagaceae bacterium]|nr:hypothetical protein [Chitinophagaceae bacterium]
MHKLVLILVLLPVSFINAQECKTKEELDIIPGKHIDVAHCEWPAQKASWLNGMKTPARKAMANKVLLAIEDIEKNSRKNFTLTGGVIKSSFSASTWCL